MDRLERDRQMRRDVVRRGRIARVMFPVLQVGAIALGIALMPSWRALLWWAWAILLWGLHSARRQPAQLVDGAVVMRLTAMPRFQAGLLMLNTFSPNVLLSVNDLPWVMLPLFAAAVAAVGLFLRFGQRPALRVDPDGISQLNEWGKPSWTLAWSDIDHVGPRARSTGNESNLIVMMRGTNRGHGQEVITTRSAHPMWVLIEWLEHYRGHPEDRAELATRAGVDRLERIHAELYDPTVEPTWFPPPRRAEDRG